MKRSLQHYGVLGMKWGVRKDDNSGGQLRATRMPPQAIKSLQSKDIHVEGFYSNASIKVSWLSMEALTKIEFQKREQMLNELAITFGNNTINDLTGARRDAMWKGCYDAVLKDAGVDEKQALMLYVYGLLEQAGVADQFHITLAKKNGKDVVILMDVDTLKPYYTVQDAINHVRQKTNSFNPGASRSTRGREKNAQGEAVFVKVDKTKSQSGKNKTPVGGDSSAGIGISNMRKQTIEKGQAKVNELMQSITALYSKK